MADSTEQDLISFIAARVPSGERVDAETDLIENELLDSLLIMDLVAHVEGRYGVRLENTDIAPRNFRTAEALAALIESRKS